jgi:transcriptional regulator with XRE-family HTH domain
MAQLRRADTPLAEWLAHAMSRWVDPETQMPGISQRKLAEETGISQTQLHEILKKAHSPGPDILKKLADFFDTNPLTLFRLAYFVDDARMVQLMEEDPSGAFLGKGTEIDVGTAGEETALDPAVQARVLELFQQLEQLLAQMPPEEQREFFDEFVRDVQDKVDTLYF